MPVLSALKHGQPMVAVDGSVLHLRIPTGDGEPNPYAERLREVGFLRRVGPSRPRYTWVVLKASESPLSPTSQGQSYPGEFIEVTVEASYLRLPVASMTKAYAAKEVLKALDGEIAPK